MNMKTQNWYWFFIIFFTSIITFFILWVYSSSALNSYFVRNVDWVNNFWEVSAIENLDLTNFWKTNALIEENYFWLEEIEKETLEQWAIKWLVNSLWDIHSEYLDPEETEQFNRVLSGDFEWIGAVVDTVDLGVIIERVLKGSPAKKYGILNGDIILEANGEKLQWLDVYEAVEKIKWPKGTSVTLKLVRSWEPDFLEIEVIRDTINIPFVETEIIEGTPNYYISVNSFGENTVREFNEALLQAQNAEGIIIDLRDNWWGYLDSAIDMLSRFIENGKLLTTTKYTDTSQNEEYVSNNNGEIIDKKIVILINGNSASASEIMAGALHDYNKAVLVWEKSYWKWSVQQPFEFENGALLKLTIAKWFTPKDRNIDKEGIEPDIEVTFEDQDYENEYDRQLEEAKKVLDLYIENQTLGRTIDAYSDLVKWDSSVTNTGTINQE